MQKCSYLFSLIGIIFQDISNADFWQLAAQTALEVARPSRSRKPGIIFKGGRPDCHTSPEDVADHDYPEPDMSRKEMMDWFANHKDGFGMNENQVRQQMYYTIKELA